MGAGGCSRTLEGVSAKSLINQIQGETEDLFLLHHAGVGAGWGVGNEPLERGQLHRKSPEVTGLIGSSVHTLPNVTAVSMPLVAWTSHVRQSQKHV